MLKKKAVLKSSKYSQENLFLMKLRAFRFETLLKKFPTQAFLCEYWEFFFKKAYFEENLWMAASE